MLLKSSPLTEPSSDPPECEFGPLATRRKRLLFAWACAERRTGPLTDLRVRLALQRGHACAQGAGTVRELTDAIRVVESIAEDAREHSSRDIWTIPEAQRLVRAGVDHLVARSVAAALNWSLDPDAASLARDRIARHEPLQRGLIHDIAAVAGIRRCWIGTG